MIRRYLCRPRCIEARWRKRRYRLRDAAKKIPCSKLEVTEVPPIDRQFSGATGGPKKGAVELRYPGFCRPAQ